MGHDFFYIRIIGFPAEDALCFFTASYQNGRVTRTAVRIRNRKILTGDLLYGLNDFQNRRAALIAKIKDIAAPALLQIPQGQNMCLCQI